MTNIYTCTYTYFFHSLHITHCAIYIHRGWPSRVYWRMSIENHEFPKRNCFCVDKLSLNNDATIFITILEKRVASMHWCCSIILLFQAYNIRCTSTIYRYNFWAVTVCVNNSGKERILATRKIASSFNSIDNVYWIDTFSNATCYYPIFWLLYCTWLLLESIIFART